jgi:hypothetical protein
MAEFSSSIDYRLGLEMKKGCTSFLDVGQEIGGVVRGFTGQPYVFEGSLDSQYVRVGLRGTSAVGRFAGLA